MKYVLKCVTIFIGIYLNLSIALPKRTLAKPTNQISQLPNIPEVPDLSDIDKARELIQQFDLKDFKFWEQLCRSLSEEQQYSQASVACSKALTIRPRQNNPDLWMNRSKALFREGRYTDAIVSYDRVLDLAPKYSLALAYRCASYFYLGRYTEAIANCNEALRINGDWATESPVIAWYYQGLSFSRLGRQDFALNAYQRALSHTPEDNQARAERCRTLLEISFIQIEKSNELSQLNDRKNNFSVDNTKLRSTIESNNRYFRFRSTTQNNEVRANPNQKSGSNPSRNNLEEEDRIALCSETETIAFYNRALEVDPQNRTALTNKGLYLERIGKFQQALTAYDRALALNSKSSFTLAHRCVVLNQLKNYQEALSTCQRSLSGDRIWANISPAHVWTQKSKAQIGLNRYEEALTSATRAIALFNDSAEAWNNKGVSLWHLQRYQEAETAIKKAIEIDPNYIQAWFNYGRILSSLQRYTEAIALYDRIRAKDFTKIDRLLYADIWVNRAVALWHLNECQQALESTKVAIALNADSLEAWYNQGVAAYCLKKYDKALYSYQQANRVAPNNVFVFTSMGIVLTKLGRYQEALAALETALGIAPNYSLALETRDRLLSIINTSLN